MEVIEMLKTSGVGGASAAQLEPVLIARRSAALKRKLSLQGLTTRAILNFHWIQDEDSGNPFKRLPNSILLQILEDFSTENGDSDEILPQRKWDLLKLLLQAASVTEMNLSPWKRTYENYCTFENLVMLNCPELQRLTLVEPRIRIPPDLMWRDFNEPPSTIKPSVLKMKNLQVLKAMAVFDADALDLAPNYLTSLRVLEFTILEEDFVHLTKLAALPTLKELYVNAFSYRAWVPVTPKVVVETLVQLPQLLPGLESLGCCQLLFPDTGTQFLARFCAVCPARPLLLSCLSLGSLSFETFDMPWPENLRVKRLVLKKVDEAAVDQICQLVPTEGLRQLELFNGHAKIIYKVVESLACNVTHLFLIDHDDDYNDPSILTAQTLDLHRILLSVPQLEDFLFSLNIINLKESPENQVTESFFKNFKQFEVLDEWQPELKRILRMFLLGCGEVDNLSIQAGEELELVLEVLRDYPNFGCRTRKLSIDLLGFDSETAITVISLMILRSPWLEEVNICQCHEGELDTWREDQEFEWFRDLLVVADVKFTYRNLTDELDFEAPTIESGFGKMLHA